MAHTLSTKYGRGGVWITQESNSNKPYHIDDLKCCFEVIQRIDPNAVVMNHMNDSRSARMISDLTGPKMTSMDYNGFCDIQTFPWGKPKEGRFKTTMLFWIASNVIASDLKALRNDSPFQEFLRLGNCSVQPSKLRESRSRMIGLFMGKDPNHTNRKDLSSRMMEHLKRYGNGEEIPLNIVPVTEYDTKTLGFTVGLKHEAKVKKILDSHPFEDIDIILNAWKRSNREGYKNRILQHAEICKQSTAFKLRGVDPELGIDYLRQGLALSDARSYVVDVCTAVHSDVTGVCYVQHLRVGRTQVLEEIKSLMSKMETTERFSFKPTILNEDASQAPTRTSARSGTPKYASLPVSKWASIPVHEVQMPTPPRNSAIPKVVATPPQSFTAAMRKPRPPSPSEDLSDDISDRTPRTRNSGGSEGNSTLSSKGSIKTSRELQLEHENQQLQKEFTEVKNVMSKLQTQHEKQMAQMQAEYQKQLKLQQDQIAALQQSMAQLQQTVASQAPAPAPAPDTPRKKPPGKKYKPSQSPGYLGVAVRGVRQMAVAAVETVAPTPTEEETALRQDEVTPQDVPMGDQYDYV